MPSNTYEQARFLGMIFEQVPIGIAIAYNYEPESSDPANVIINPRYEQITGRSKEELIGLGWAKITHPGDLEKALQNFRRLQAGQIPMYAMDKRYIKPDGSIVWVHMIVAPFTLPNTEQKSHICLIQDITGHKAVEKALHESERSKSVFLSHLPGLAYRCNKDRDWTMQYVSEGCFGLTGYPPESLLYNRDLSYNDIIAPEYRELLWEEWERILPKRLPFKYEYEIVTATGERKWVLELGQGVYNEQGEVEALEGIVLDISDRKAMEDTLKYNSEHDSWTGLYNRNYLISLLKKDLTQKKGLKKALIGINLGSIHLLTINYGFHYSQNLIKKAAEVLSRYCKENCLLFHTRENRFLFYLLDYKDKNELVAFSKTIVEALEGIFVTDRISGGIGILEIAPDESEVNIEEGLLRRVLIASERSVSLLGKDFEVCFCDEELEAVINRERDIVEALNYIAAEDYTNNELYLQYQPVMDIKTGFICGFEALARLRTKKLGPVSPVEFIPLAEKTKLILPIGEKVIIQAFSFLNRLTAQGYNDIAVSINISAIQLLNPGFTGRLLELVREMQVNPENVAIEITESVFVSDFDYINNIIGKLRAAGFRIAIDDFGTGYSSLAREEELAVDCIKIDKHFIDKLLGQDLSKVITGNIISISHKLGHCTIAEGVEHEKQLQHLKEYGCDRVQGYLISKPLDEEDAISFLRNNYTEKLC